MMLQTLLLNSTYECISFISERKVFKLLAKDKIEILESWDSFVVFGRGMKIRHPAVVKLRHHVRWIPRKVRFNYVGVFRRDQYLCQYCGLALTNKDISVDHVVPKERGGENSWKNCVTACKPCNNFKRNRTPEEAGLKLLKKPIVPTLTIKTEFSVMKHKHESWKDYVF